MNNKEISKEQLEETLAEVQARSFERLMEIEKLQHEKDCLIETIRILFEKIGRN